MAQSISKLWQRALYGFEAEGEWNLSNAFNSGASIIFVRTDNVQHALPPHPSFPVKDGENSVGKSLLPSGNNL